MTPETEESPDLDERELCADGACTGVLGADGRCRECGRSPAEVASPPPDEDELLDAPGFDDRRLCPDGACVGVLGDDGRCRVCGKSE